MQNLTELQATLSTLQNKLVDLENDRSSLESEIARFEYEVDESEFDEILNNANETFKVGYLEFYPSDILKNCDPVAYRCAKSDYEGNFDLDDCEDYQDLQNELESLDNEIADIEQEIEEIENDIENLESE